LPAAALRHAPFPSQVPSFPQGLVDVSSVQASRPLLPLATGAHVPSGWPVSALEQAKQPVQLVAAQQTSSMQRPLEHWVLEVQAVPAGDPGASVGGRASGQAMPPPSELPPEPLVVPPVESEVPEEPEEPPELWVPELPPVCAPPLPPFASTLAASLLLVWHCPTSLPGSTTHT
jgi:hypothetical protein